MLDKIPYLSYNSHVFNYGWDPNHLGVITTNLSLREAEAAKQSIKQDRHAPFSRSR